MTVGTLFSKQLIPDSFQLINSRSTLPISQSRLHHLSCRLFSSHVFISHLLLSYSIFFLDPPSYFFLFFQYELVSVTSQLSRGILLPFHTFVLCSFLPFCNIFLVFRVFHYSSTTPLDQQHFIIISKYIFQINPKCSSFPDTHVRMSVCALLLSCAIFCATPAFGSLQERRLYEDLMRNYNNLERPVANHSEPVTVHLKVRTVRFREKYCF